MNEPKINIGCVANLYSRMMYFEKAGEVEYGHTHSFDHLTLLASGSLKVVVEGVATEFKSPHMIYIHKDKNHELTALENNTVVYCIHALRDVKTEDILDPSMIPQGVSPTSLAMPLCIGK
jgi:quercetin dioxygenase-like cupin family protein